MKYVLCTTIAFGIARFIVPVTGAINKADIFKDMAHIFVGGLFGAAIALIVAFKLLRTLGEAISPSLQAVKQQIQDCCIAVWMLAIGLTILEVVAFFMRQN